MELPGETGPLDVDGMPVVFLDARSDLGELEEGLVVERGLALGHDRALEDLPRDGVHDEAVGVHLPRDERLAEAEAGLDDGLALAPAERVAGEEDARGLGLDELLDDDRHAEAPRSAGSRVRIQEDAVPEDGRPAFLDRLLEGGLARDVEDALVLSGEARPREVLLGPARADGERSLEHARRLVDPVAELVRDRSEDHPPSEVGEELPGLVELERVELGLDLLEVLGEGRHELLEGLGREDEPGRDREPGARERPERSRLAAHERAVLLPELREVEGQGEHATRVPMRTSVSMPSPVVFTRSSSNESASFSATRTTVEPPNRNVPFSAPRSTFPGV